MNKVPTVHRCAMTGGVQNPCASQWFKFMAEEESFNDRPLNALSYWLKARNLEAVPHGSICSPDLEEAIVKWSK